MLEKNQILIVIIVLLLIFYFVISFSAGRSKDPVALYRINRYLFGVRILISFLAIVSLILWLLI